MYNQQDHKHMEAGYSDPNDKTWIGLQSAMQISTYSTNQFHVKAMASMISNISSQP